MNAAEKMSTIGTDSLAIYSFDLSIKLANVEVEVEVDIRAG